jgi:hypothetical protein
MDLVTGFFVLGLLVAVYFAPCLIAGIRNHHQSGSILVINLFLGWTFIGWVVALAMACSAVRQPPPSA